MSGAVSDAIYNALRDAVDLAADSPSRTRLWIAIWEHATTRHHAEVVPRGSTLRVLVTHEYASVEVIAAWEWLTANERVARAMTPEQLHAAVRGVATRSHRGSARAAMADALRGLTNVPAGTRVDVVGIDEAFDRLAS
jgi:hypothetical protein